MRRFVEGVDRGQTTLFPECLEDWIGEDNPVRVVDVFVEELDLAELGFGGVDPEATGRPWYHPSILLKLYIYGYLNRVQSSRRLEYEAGRNVEVMWLLCRLVPDHKTIADFRKDNGAAIRKVCAHFIAQCRAMGLLTQANVAIDGSKFKAVNNRDKNFTRAKMERRMTQIEKSVARYLEQLDTADRQEPSEALQTKTNRLKEKIETLKQQMRRLERLKVEMLATPDQQISLTDPDARSMATSGRGSGVVGYNVQIASGGMKLPRDKSLVARNPGFQVPFAAKIRKDAQVATMAVGLILDPQQAEAILQSGEADLIALAREMLADPNFAAQAALELEGAAGWDLWSDQFRYWLERRAKTLKREGRA